MLIKLSPTVRMFPTIQLNINRVRLRGQDDIKVVGSEKSDPIKEQKILRKKLSFQDLLHKYQKIAEQKLNNRLEGNRRKIVHYQEQRNINSHLIGQHHLFPSCISHGVHIQVYLILTHGSCIIHGCHIVTINILLMLQQGVKIHMIINHGFIKLFINGNYLNLYIFMNIQIIELLKTCEIFHMCHQETSFCYSVLIYKHQHQVYCMIFPIRVVPFHLQK